MLATESEPPMSYNVSYYENEKVDQLLKDGLATADEDKRGEIYGEYRISYGRISRCSASQAIKTSGQPATTLPEYIC